MLTCNERTSNYFHLQIQAKIVALKIKALASDLSHFIIEINFSAKDFN